MEQEYRSETTAGGQIPSPSASLLLVHFRTELVLTTWCTPSGSPCRANLKVRATGFSIVRALRGVQP
jgi:hypothetical protein